MRAGPRAPSSRSIGGVRQPGSSTQLTSSGAVLDCRWVNRVGRSRLGTLGSSPSALTIAALETMASQFECLPEPVIDAVFDLVAADERWAWSSTLQGRAKPLLLLSRFLYAFGQQAMLKDVEVQAVRDAVGLSAMIGRKPETLPLLRCLHISVPGLHDDDVEPPAIAACALLACVASTLQSVEFYLPINTMADFSAVMPILSGAPKLLAVKRASCVISYGNWTDDEEAGEPDTPSAVAFFLELFGPALRSFDLWPEAAIMDAEDMRGVGDRIERAMPRSLRSLAVHALPGEFVAKLMRASSASLHTLLLAPGRPSGHHGPGHLSLDIEQPLTALRVLEVDAMSMEASLLREMPSIEQFEFRRGIPMGDASGTNDASDAVLDALPTSIRHLIFRLEPSQCGGISALTRRMATATWLPQLESIKLFISQMPIFGEKLKPAQVKARIGQAIIDIAALRDAAMARPVRIDTSFRG